MNFEEEARIKFLRLLGFSKDELEKKVAWVFFIIAVSMFFHTYVNCDSYSSQNLPFD